MISFFAWKQAFRRKSAWFSLAVMLAFGIVAGLAPWIAPHDPYRWGITQSNLPPAWVEGTANPGRAEYPLGTDRYGRDVLSRLIFGTRTAFFLALTAVPISAIIGTAIGLSAGYLGGKFESITMLVAGMIQSLPGIMFMVIIILIFRSWLTPTWFHGLLTLIVGFAAVSWVSLAQLIRMNVILIKAQLFVEAAIGLGASSRYIMLHHIFPNVLHLVLVWIINNIPAVILMEAVLGYVGVGITGAVDGGEFTVVSWGGMFFAGRSALSRNPLMLVIPSVCILLISMSFILLADVLNETSRQAQD